MRKLSCLTLLAIFGVFFSLAVSAQAQIGLQPFLSDLSSPVFITNAGDGSGRLFVVEKGGVIKVVPLGSTTPSVFLNISSKVSTDGERGLLGLAFHPQYKTNGRFFVYYTRASDGAIEIAEYPGEKIIITIPHPTNNNHNGGTIAFGQDGYLYAGPGDGGSGNDPPNNAQNLDTLLGKIIRIDINSGAAPYSIPPDNPFVGIAGRDEIYAYGLRNPYRFSFDRLTGQLWVGDVGQGEREEVDIITRGGNYGWRVYEGTRCTGLGPAACIAANYIMPVFEYSSAGQTNPRCSVTGGYVYRGTQGTLPLGTYIYGDFCSGEIFTGAQPTVLLDTARSIVSFGEDEAGELYVVGFGGTVDKIATPTAATVTVGGRVTTANGRGIRSVVVTMTDSSGNMRTATTSIFGYYRFTDVPAGETYIFTVRGKRFTFGTNTQVQSIVEDTDAINFVADSF
jgi:hypothetical protein